MEIHSTDIGIIKNKSITSSITFVRILKILTLLTYFLYNCDSTEIFKERMENQSQ